VGASPLSGSFGQPLDSLVVPGMPDGIAISSDGRRAYVTDRLLDRVWELDVDAASLTSGSVLFERVVPGAALTGGIDVDPVSGDLDVATSNLGLIALDPESD